jgi:hypothetical protein
MPIVATGKFDLLDMAVLLYLVAPSKHHSLEGREHGRTIPLAEAAPAGEPPPSRDNTAAPLQKRALRQ